MRRLVLVAAPMMLAGCAACAAPPSDGGLWSRQALQEELTLSRIPDSQRAQTAKAFELQLADEDLNAEQARIQQCQSGTTAVPESINIRIANDPARLMRLGQLALASSLVQAGNCEAARAALTGAPPAQPAAPLDPRAQAALAESALGWSDPQ